MIGLPPRFAPLCRYWPATAAVVAATTLAIVHAFEAAGYEPCALCLRQREVYWTVLGISAASAWFWMRTPESRMSRGVDALLGVAFLTGAAVAGFHAGVEWGFWDGPASCTTGALSGMTGDDIAAALGSGGPAVMCDEAAWRDPVLRISMAGWNALISLALSAMSFMAARRDTEYFEATLEPNSNG